MVWKQERLGSICSFKSGDAFKQDLQGRNFGDVPFVKVSDFSVVGNEIAINRANNWVSTREAEKYTVHPIGATLFAKIGIALTYNRRRRVVRPTIADNNLMSAVPKDVDPAWLYYLFCTLDFNAVSSGSALPYLTVRDLAAIDTLVPPPNDQRRIASILSALDDKIELNRRMNETLEASARALFRDWFVDFGPTHAKAEGRPAYLAPDIWSLFPDRLNDDGVPEGWRVGALSDIIDVSPVERLKRGAVAPYLDMAALPTSGPSAQPAVDREFSSGSRFRNGDTLLARITPCLENGKTAFVRGLPENIVAWGSTEFIVLRSIWPVPEAVSYLLARDDDFRSHAIRNMTGTSGRQRVAAEAVANYPMALPCDDDLWRALSPALDASFERIARNERVSQALAKIRDGLLPKLMSGELRVRDAEALVAA